MLKPFASQRRAHVAGVLSGRVLKSGRMCAAESSAHAYAIVQPAGMTLGSTVSVGSLVLEVVVVVVVASVLVLVDVSSGRSEISVVSGTSAVSLV